MVERIGRIGLASLAVFSGIGMLLSRDSECDGDIKSSYDHYVCETEDGYQVQHEDSPPMNIPEDTVCHFGKIHLTSEGARMYKNMFYEIVITEVYPSQQTRTITAYHIPIDIRPEC